MKGAVVDLPAPVGKAAATTAPLRIERRDVAGQGRRGCRHDRLPQLVARDRAPRRLQQVARPRIACWCCWAARSRAAGRPTAPASWSRGQLPRIRHGRVAGDVGEGNRRGYRRRAATAKDERALALNGVDVEVGNARRVRPRAARLQGRRAARGRRLADDAARPRSRRHGDVARRLVRVAQWTRDGAAREIRAARSRRAAAIAQRTAKPARMQPIPGPNWTSWLTRSCPAGATSGKLELVAKPNGPDWRIQKLALSSVAGRIDASGWWRVRPRPADDGHRRRAGCRRRRCVPRAVRLSGRRAQCADEDHRKAFLDGRAERLRLSDAERNVHARNPARGNS